MRPTLLTSLLLVSLLAGPPRARAQEPAPLESTPGDTGEGTDPAALEVTTSGYLDSRTTWSHVVAGGLLPTVDVPALANITEGNFQLKLRWGDKGLAYADTSFFWQAGGLYRTTGADGNLVDAPAHDNPALRPAAVVSELYGSYAFGEHANLVLGKKRLVWGAGFAQNPTDLLNPPKDPTDPTFQRAGSWLAKLEFPFDRFTVSLVGAAKVLRQYGGLPSTLLYYPDYPTAEGAANPALDDRDLQPHFAAAARLYALVADTDVNAFYFFSNLYNDAFDHKSRVGLSLSRVFGGLEAHAEALAQQGSQRVYADEGCVDDPAALLGCLASGRVPAARTRFADDAVVLKALVGARYMFEDSGILSLEYFHNGEGYSQAEYQSFLRLLATSRELAKTNAQAAALVARAAGQGAADPGSPQKFSFDAQRVHYLFLSYQRPQIADDFTLNVVLLASLADLSGQLAPSVTWSAREWLNVSLAAFVPLPGFESRGVDVRAQKYTEYGLLPSDWRVYGSVRAFY